MVSYLDSLKKELPDVNLVALVAEASADHLQAVMMTTLTTVAGPVSLAYGIGELDPYMSPMVLAFGCGLLFATPLTLALVPCLYMIFHDIGRILYGKVIVDYSRWIINSDAVIVLLL